ncbi:BREX-1 system adenine-specific DNA-methyltransferase PglX [Sellimonas intestinalis]|uniref:BREX-1 system adenine-specific DNA-methyltransferase PglX n=1 Tax=Sellimonas intestinalis TaxID=1653434 RepID=UPI0015EC1F66|nr:BREX-1 system adenine-specific DNA-methyltransferase PglX [Sellimonas intestinalis]MBA2212500.1 BREX-1 system adenine-specific DNA-methyltransferase PglX [Sellimonas intestinalis]
MDKNAIKKFAVWARTELIARVSLKGVEYGITEDKIEDANADSVGGKVLTADEKKQRQALIAEINDKGYKQVMEEVAYTWFNRFSALRFMEVNGYLPSHVRVFTDEENNFKPQIITEAIHLDLDGLDMEKVYELKDAEKTEELYKYLLIVQCNALNKILPGMFQKIADYTELLLPDNLLREGSVIQQMIELIPEDDWKDAVQIIGWLYQFYNIEPKAAALAKDEKIVKEEIPAATELFTPDWVVHYMVENSLGRLWEDGHPDTELKSKWKYYLEEAEQELEVQEKITEIRKEYALLVPEQLKVIDPCSGSGHILVYMFDVLLQIYEAYGYTTREAVASIVENNLHGLDIDDRAAQLAYFAVMMKARQYDRRFFRRGIQPKVYAIVESNNVDKFAVDYFCNGDAKLTTTMDSIISELHDAKEYGSILTVTPQDWSALYDRFAEITEDINISRETALRELLPLVQVAELLSQKYDTVVTNPPYLSVSELNAEVSEFIKKTYPDSKNDLYSVFIERCRSFTKKLGLQAMITQQAWMFTALYESLRIKLKSTSIVNLIQLGAHAFDEIGGEVVQTAAFIIRNTPSGKYKGVYMDLTDGASEKEKEKFFLSHINTYATEYSDFDGVPNTSMAYWLSQQALRDFSVQKISQVATTREGMTTADNESFLREWYEVSQEKIGIGIKSVEESISSGYKWYPYNKGGSNRKWYGNNDIVVNWYNDGMEIRNLKDKKTGRIRSHNYNLEYSFRESGTWTAICSGNIMVRYSAPGALFDSKGASVFANSMESLLYIIGLLNTKVSNVYLKVLSPAFEFKVGHVANVPIIMDKRDEAIRIVNVCISLSKNDWDSFETSWDFKEHPLIRNKPFTYKEMEEDLKHNIHDRNQISEAYQRWENECYVRFTELKENEEELNRIFINIYGLQDELTPEVEDKDVTVRKADLGRDIRSFISYAVGCMFGRYSLDIPGLVYAGGNFDEKYCRWISQFGAHANEKIDANGQLIEGGWAGSSLWKYDGVRVENQWRKASYPPDTDNIIPICDDEYFEDDIVGRFVEFVKTVYGADTLDENLKFIADALGGKGQPKDVIRNYFLNDFYKDHCKIYQKRPIYWLFDSGKKNGFKALIYMHRYQPDTIARIRTDYVHEQQARYRTAIADLEQRIANASTGERVKLNRKLTTLQAQDTEIRTYEEKIHHLADQMISIDLDDGVKKNYAIFQDVLAKIK